MRTGLVGIIVALLVLVTELFSTLPVTDEVAVSPP
jgi:hypothetical protein